MLTVTASAARQVLQYMQRQERDGQTASTGLRLGVRGGGCSGLEYVMELADGGRDSDEVYEFHGLKVYVDPKSLDFLNGMELDFVDGIQDHGFHFRNPNEKSRCGCGTSFSV